MPVADTVALVPARGGSKGLPGKNARVLVDRPLIAHSVSFALSLPSVSRVVVSSDDPDLVRVALEFGAESPELRPEHLAGDSTPMAPVIRHVADLLDQTPDPQRQFMLLLDPTSPCREASQVEASLQLLRQSTEFDGAVSVSEPSFNPLWVGVTQDCDGVVTRHPLTSTTYTRRQEVPPYLRVNGSFYIWQWSTARTLDVDWLDVGQYLGIRTRELWSHSIDSEDDFRLVESLIESGAIRLPWMEAWRERQS